MKLTQPIAMVFRFNDPPGRKGQICRVRRLGAVIRNEDGTIDYNVGSEFIAVTFDSDGATLMVPRQSIVRADSKAGRQTIAKVRRGGTTMAEERKRRVAG